MGMRYKDFKIKNKLLIAFLIIVIMNTVPMVISFYTLKTFKNTLNVSSRESGEMELFLKAKNLILEQQRLEKDFLLTDDQSYLSADSNTDEKIDKILSLAITSARDDRSDDIAEIEELKDLIENYEDSFTKVLELYNSGNRDGALKLATGGHQAAIDQVNQSIEELLNDVKDDVEAAYLKAGESADSTINWFTITLATASLSVLLAIVFSFVISSNLTRPIGKLRDVVEKVSLGDMTASFKTDRKDEIGQLATAFERMIVAIRFFTKELDKKR